MNELSTLTEHEHIYPLKSILYGAWLIVMDVGKTKVTSLFEFRCFQFKGFFFYRWIWAPNKKHFGIHNLI